MTFRPEIDIITFAVKILVFYGIDAWLSLVERCVRDAEAAGSNPVASMKPEFLVESRFSGFFNVMSSRAKYFSENKNSCHRKDDRNFICFYLPAQLTSYTSAY